MSDDPRPQGLDSVLAYEDLDAAERLEADRYLAIHPELAAQLHRFRDAERAARQEVPAVTNDGFWTDHRLSTEEEAQCRDSARRIRTSLAAGDRSAAPAVSTNSVSSRRSWNLFQVNPRWLLPVAAVLALIVIGPQLARREAILTGLTVDTVAVTTAGTRSADLAPLAAGTLRTGDAFVLAFDLKADSYLAIIHVDPLGEVALVYPQDQSRVARLAGGRRHRLPDPDNDEKWILGGATGRESFVIATDRETAPLIDELRTSLAASTEDLDRSAVLVAVRELLDATWDQVEFIEISHVE